MFDRALALPLACLVLVLSSGDTHATHEFYGRSGNAIELDLSRVPGVSPNALFSGLSLTGFAGHTVLTSSDLNQGDFASDGRLWVFPNPARSSAALGDTHPDDRGFQGTLVGSVLAGGQPLQFSVTVQPGYTGAGPGSVNQSGERLTRGRNNRLFVAQQQHRLNYLGFVPEGGGQLVVDGQFGVQTDEAVSTFQAAFVGGVNTGQANVDGIVGPNTAAWLNAANAPTWDELVDPDPQARGAFTVAGMIGDFDILPSRDNGNGPRTGLTPQVERFGTSWAQNLWRNGSALAKQVTGLTQLMNAMSTADGYGSSFAHATHRAGMDIDMHTLSAAQGFGDGHLNRSERAVVNSAVAYIDAGESGGPTSGHITRFISSNSDILDGIVAARPGTATYLDSGGAHLSHLHVDVGSPDRVDGLADQPGDFNFDDQVNALDYLVWQRGSSRNPLSGSDLAAWRAYFGVAAQLTTITIPEPSATCLVFTACVLCGTTRRPREI